MPRGRRWRQGPRNPIRAAANYANAHPWQQMDRASPGVAYTPLVDPWIEKPCCGDPVCVRTVMEQKSPGSGAPSAKPAQRGAPAGRMPGPWPLRVDFHWVPGSDPGTFDGSPWLLDRFLAQLGDYMSFRFEHYQDNLSRVCEILGRLTGRARAWAAPYLDGDLPLPDDYELFCQDLEEVVQDPHSFAEYRAAVPCALPPASSQPPVASQLPVVRQYLARFSEALALNMGALPRPAPAVPATPALPPRPDSAPGDGLAEQQLAKEGTPGPTPALSSSAGSAGAVGAAAPKPAPVPSEAVRPLAQKPDLTCTGGPEPPKTEEVSDAQGDPEVSSGAPQEVLDTPGAPGGASSSSAPRPTSLGSERDPGSGGAPCEEAACEAREPRDPYSAE